MLLCCSSSTCCNSHHMLQLLPPALADSSSPSTAHPFSPSSPSTAHPSSPSTAVACMQQPLPFTCARAALPVLRHPQPPPPPPPPRPSLPQHRSMGHCWHGRWVAPASGLRAAAGLSAARPPAPTAAAVCTDAAQAAGRTVGVCSFGQVRAPSCSKTVSFGVRVHGCSKLHASMRQWCSACRRTAHPGCAAHWAAAHDSALRPQPSPVSRTRELTGNGAGKKASLQDAVLRTRLRAPHRLTQAIASLPSTPSNRGLHNGTRSNREKNTACACTHTHTRAHTHTPCAP